MSDAGSESESLCSDEQFKKSVKEWVGIHDKQTELRRIINSQNKRKKQLAENIVNFMKSQDKEILNLGTSGALQVKNRKTSVAFKKDYVEELLKKFLKNEESAKQGADFLFENKQTKFSSVLHRREQPI
jgi:hypothetical protein